MDNCPNVLASTGAEMFAPLLFGVLVLVAGVVVFAVVRRRARVGTVVGGVLLLALAIAVVPSGATPAHAVEGCPSAVALPAVPPVVTPPIVVPPTEPPVCAPSVALAPPDQPAYWVSPQISDGANAYLFTVTPDPAWQALADAAGAQLSVAHDWTFTGYVVASTADGEFVADTSATPWVVNGTGSGLSVTVDTNPAIDAQSAELAAAHPEAERFFPVLVSLTGQAVVTATYSDGCAQASVSFPVTFQPGGGGGNN